MEWETLDELQDIIELRNADPSSLYRKIRPQLNYGIEFAEDRVKQIKENWDEELYVDCISSPYFKESQIKSQDDELSEANGTMTNHLDRLADYILFCPFDNQEDKRVYEERELRIKQLREQKKTEQREKELLKEREKKKNRSGLLANFRLSKSNYKEDRLYYISQSGKLIDREITDEVNPPVHYIWKDKELNQKGNFKNSRRYWRHFAKRKDFHSIFLKEMNTQPYSTFAFESLNVFLKDIKLLEEALESKRVGSPEFLEIKKRITNTRSNYNIASEVLRDPTILSTSMKVPKDNMDADTLRRVNYCNEEDIMYIMLGYKDLKKKYEFKIGTAWWSILKDIESIQLDKLLLKPEEKTVLTHILETGEHTNEQIRPILEYTYNKEYQSYYLSRLKSRVAAKIAEQFQSKILH